MDYLELRNKRKSLGLTQKQLAILLGVSGNTIINWEKGEKIPASKYTILDKILNNKSYIESENDIHVLNEEPTGYYYKNVTASAGLETEIINDDIQKIPVNIPGWGKDISFINVYGDSMYPKYCSGEIIGIKEVEPKYINFGYAYVVVFNDGQVFLKYIRKGKDEDHWLLASENPKYEDREYHLSLIRKIYIVKGVITKTTM